MPTVKKFESSDDEDTSALSSQKSKWEDEDEGTTEFRKPKKDKKKEKEITEPVLETEAPVSEKYPTKSTKEKKKDKERNEKSDCTQKQKDRDSRMDRVDRDTDRSERDRDRRDNRDRGERRVREGPRRDEFRPSYDRNRRGGHRNERSGPKRDQGHGRDRRDNRDRRNRDRSSDGPAWATSRVKDHAEQLKQRKLLWGGKSAEKEESCEGASSSAPQQVEKNMGMWSNAIAATGVDNKQAEKFKKLLGFKGAATSTETAPSNVQEERARQRKLMSSLDKQFEMAREATHMGRGMGLGFHQ